MAKGISQDQVSQAADQLLFAGERPTIERIRALLGTGSPNTVNRLLDIWWTSLGSRLSAQTVKLAIPGAPKEVIQLATQLWENAVLSAEDRLSNEKCHLNEEHTQAIRAINEREDRFNDQMKSLTSAKDKAEMALLATNQRVMSLNQLIEKNAAHLIEIKQQRDCYKMELQQSQVALSLSRSDIDDKLKNWEIERNELVSSHQATQDRWILEVDRARQEEAKLVSKLKLVKKQYEGDIKHITSVNADLIERNRLLESASNAIKSRIDALESELKRLHGQLSLALTNSTKLKVPVKVNKSKLKVTK